MSKRKTPRRHSIPQKLILVVNCLLVIGCFAGAIALVTGEQLVGSQLKAEIVPNLANAADAELGPAETFPAADPKAKNFLITGADNNQCVDPGSPYAGAFGDRSDFGERSDTIMIMRVDPSTNQAAVLSFPRDLWVSIAGTTSENRINSAYVQNDPNNLIATIYQNFRIGIDHFIQVDFCAFKTLVDAVGGVPVPFAYVTRDSHTGLYVTEPSCYTFDGDHALAYVRSRHYEYWDPAKNKWVEDPSADLGRISRQQDFLRRVAAKALSTGVYTPSVARGLIETAREYVVTDTNLTPKRMLEFAGVIQSLAPSALRSYQIEVTADTRSGNAVLIPRLGGNNMKAILDVFRGDAALANAPDQDEGGVTATTSVPPTTTPVTTTTAVVSGGAVTTATANPNVTVATLPEIETSIVDAQENTEGIVPPKDFSC